MLTKRVKLMIVLGLLLSCLLGILGGMGVKTMMFPVKDNPQQLPRRTLWVTIDRSQWDQFLNQLRKFSDKWGYAIRIAPLDPDGNRFNVEMWRADMKLTAFMDTSFDNGTIQIHFYDTDRVRPVPDSYFDEEANDLKKFVNEIPNVTITEEK